MAEIRSAKPDTDSQGRIAAWAHWSMGAHLKAEMPVPSAGLGHHFFRKSTSAALNFSEWLTLQP